MQILVEPISPEMVAVRPLGRMDVDSSPNVRQTLLDLAEKGARAVVVDLQAVDFMDSSGLSALVAGMKALRNCGGSLTICRTNAQIRTALRLTMLDRVLPSYETLDAAIQAMGNHTQA